VGQVRKTQGIPEGCASIFFVAVRQNNPSNTTDYAELQSTPNASPGGVQRGNENRRKLTSSITLKIQFWR